MSGRGRTARASKNNGGFTLVELTVYMLITTIILIVVAQVMGTMSGMFANTRTRSDAKQLGDAVYSYVAEELRYTTYLAVHDPADSDATGNTQLRVEDGVLLRNGSNYFGDEFYGDKRVELAISELTAFNLDLTVRVLDSEGIVLYETTSTVELINIKITGLGLMYTATVGVNPTLTYTRGTKA